MTRDSGDTLYRALRAHRRAVLWLGVIVPIVLILLGAALIWLWLPDLPDPAATHWSGGPEPDGFDAPSTYLGLLMGMGGGMAVVFAGIAYGTELGSPGAFTGMWMAIFNLAMAGFMDITMCWSVAMQRGLSDAHQAGSVTPSIVAATVTAVVLGLGAWLILRATGKRLGTAREDAAREGDMGEDSGAPCSGPSVTRANPFPLAPGERLMWSGTARMGRLPLTIVGAAALLALAACLPGFMTDSSSLWITGTSAVIVILAVVSSMTFRVVIGHRGITVRSLVGLPRVHVPADRVAAVAVVDVNPFAEFGGWGWRFGAGRAMGFVLRKGPGLEVARTDGSCVVVTIDNAAEAAAVLRAVSGVVGVGARPRGGAGGDRDPGGGDDGADNGGDAR